MRICKMVNSRDIIEDIVGEIIGEVERVARDKRGRTPVRKAVEGNVGDIRGRVGKCGGDGKIDKVGKFEAPKGKFEEKGWMKYGNSRGREVNIIFLLGNYSNILVKFKKVTAKF